MNWLRQMLTRLSFRRSPDAPDSSSGNGGRNDTGRIQSSNDTGRIPASVAKSNWQESPQQPISQTQVIGGGNRGAAPAQTGYIQQPQAAPAPVQTCNGDPDVPERIGSYRVVKLIGEGGMGRVYMVEFGEPNEEGDVQRYALKTITPLDATDVEFYERFKREIMIGMKLRHANVCCMVDWGIEENGVPYLVMELLEGEVLSVHVQRSAPFDLERSRNITLQILAGLDAIHGAGVVHRDLKPANVFLTTEGYVKLMDFGIARQEGARSLTVTGAALGTPEFVAPEQVLDTKRVDPRADLFNVGLILYQMLTSHLPFESNSVDGTLLRLVKGDRTPISDFRGDLPDAVADWLEKILSKKPADRFQSAVEAARAINF